MHTLAAVVFLLLAVTTGGCSLYFTFSLARDGGLPLGVMLLLVLPGYVLCALSLLALSRLGWHPMPDLAAGAPERLPDVATLQVIPVRIAVARGGRTLVFILGMADKSRRVGIETLVIAFHGPALRALFVSLAF